MTVQSFLTERSKYNGRPIGYYIIEGVRELHSVLTGTSYVTFHMTETFSSEEQRKHILLFYIEPWWKIVGHGKVKYG